MSKICKKCHASAVASGVLDSVRNLLSQGGYLCPNLDRKCGNTDAILGKQSSPFELPPEPISVPTDCYEPKKPDSGANHSAPSVREELSESVVRD